MKKDYITPTTDVINIKMQEIMSTSNVKWAEAGSANDAESRGSSFDWEEEIPSRKDLWDNEEDYDF